jgi:hypothetical protein
MNSGSDGQFIPPSAEFQEEDSLMAFRILMANSRLLILMIHEHAHNECAGRNPAECREVRKCDDIKDANSHQQDVETVSAQELFHGPYSGSGRCKTQFKDVARHQSAMPLRRLCYSEMEPLMRSSNPTKTREGTQ